MDNMHASGGVYQRIEDGMARQPLYSFDTGICMNGLIELHKATKDTTYLEFARKMGDFLVNASRESGVPYPAIEESNPVLGDRWSLSYGCHLIKLCMPLYKLHLLTGEEKYLILVDGILSKQMKLLDADKFYVNSKDRTVYMHANLYALEGLAFLDSAGYSDFSGVLPGCARWVARQQNEDGSLYNYADGSHGRQKVTDATAQAVRMMIYVDKEKLSDNIGRGLGFLTKMQSAEKDARSFGGFYYSDSIRHVNSWATFFAMQAISWNMRGPKPAELI
jgi:hypothetical protein